MISKTIRNGILITPIVKELGKYRNLSEQERQIQNLRNQYVTAWNEQRIEILDLLESYGEQGITTISELISSQFGSEEVKTHGLNIISNFKNNH
jgi:transcription initiation factor TFIID subunit TAF12